MSSDNSNSGTWSGTNNKPSSFNPGDFGGNTITYTTKQYPSTSGNYAFSGSASVSTQNGSNGLPSGA